MSIVNDAVAAYNAKAKSDHRLGVDRANERDVADRVAIASKANEVLQLSGNDEIVWSEMTTSTVDDNTLLYHFTAHGYQFIGYMRRSVYRVRYTSEAKPVIEMAIAPWAKINSGEAIRDFLWTEGYDTIDSFADFGEAILAHMYEHKMPDRLKISVAQKRGGAFGTYTAVLDSDLWAENVHAYGEQDTRIEKYERMLQRYRAMGGRPGVAPKEPQAPKAPKKKKKKGLWCWSKP